jgi:hypothetical protein
LRWKPNWRTRRRWRPADQRRCCARRRSAGEHPCATAATRVSMILQR